MSNWSAALLLIGVIGVGGCRDVEQPPETMTNTPPPQPPAPQEPAPQEPAPQEPAPLPEPATPEPATPEPAPREPAPQPPPRSAPPPAVRTFAVYTLSRGTGVPPEAKEALQKVVALAEEDERRGVKVTVTTTRIGIEGETRACIAYEDPQEGARAYEQAREFVKDVGLINLKAEPCP